MKTITILVSRLTSNILVPSNIISISTTAGSVYAAVYDNGIVFANLTLTQNVNKVNRLDTYRALNISQLVARVQEDLRTLSCSMDGLIYLTSRLYVVENYDSLSMSGTSLISGLLEPLMRYYNMLPEEMNMSGVSLESGLLRTLLIYYGNYIPEEMSISGVSLESGLLQTLLISYNNYIPEEMSMSGITLTGGTLQ